MSLALSLSKLTAVEMSAARLRALTHCAKVEPRHDCDRRNECGPFEGIDTCFAYLPLYKYLW